MLVTGPHGVGKSAILLHVLATLRHDPRVHAHVVHLPLRAWAGERPATVRARLRDAFRDALHRAPAVLLLDDLDQVHRATSD